MIKRSRFSKITLLLAILIFGYFGSKACTVIVVGAKASKDGSVIVSQTDNGDDSRIRVVPAMDFPKGAKAPVYWGIQEVNRPLDDLGKVLGYIPQVRHTYQYFLSAYPHMNEHQLTMAESTTSQRTAMKFDRSEGEQIMTIEQAQIFALQRCKTAREAVELIGELMETYGFLPSCIGESESLAIADTKEVWIFEVKSTGAGWKRNSEEPGAVWAAQRVPDDHVLIIPNWSIIKTIDIADKDNFMASPNYKQFAIDKGWYNPDSGLPFNWQEAYSPIPREWATGRFWLFYQQTAPNLKQWPKRALSSPYDGQNPYVQYVEPLSMYPFSVKPEEKWDVEEVIAYQRSFFEGTIYDMSEDPDWYVVGKEGKMEKSPLATPFPTTEMRKLLDINNRRNVARGGYGMVAQLRHWLPDAIGGVYWVYQDNQTPGIYAPIYAGVTELNPVIKTYNPEQFDANSLRWAIDFVDNLLYLKWQEAYADVKPQRDALEAQFRSEMRELEAEAAKLYKKNPEKAKALLTNWTWEKMDEMMALYTKMRYELITKYTNNKQGINF